MIVHEYGIRPTTGGDTPKFDEYVPPLRPMRDAKMKVNDEQAQLNEAVSDRRKLVVDDYKPGPKSQQMPLSDQLLTELESALRMGEELRCILTARLRVVLTPEDLEPEREEDRAGFAEPYIPLPPLFNQLRALIRTLENNNREWEKVISRIDF